jgi:hypothetical protein
MPEITDLHLLMYLDGVADAQTKNLIEEEGDYRMRLDTLRGFQQELHSQLFRVTCPSSLELGEYHLEVLRPQRANAVKQHLLTCPHCSREYAILEKTFAPGWIERVVATLVSGGKPTGFQPLTLAPGLRGGSDAYFYEAEGAQIAIEVKEDSQNPGRKVLIGLITGMDAREYEVSLWREERQFATAAIDTFDNFVIRNLETGEYELFIRGPRVEIQVQTFMI